MQASFGCRTSWRPVLTVADAAVALSLLLPQFVMTGVTPSMPSDLASSLIAEMDDDQEKDAEATCEGGGEGRWNEIFGAELRQEALERPLHFVPPQKKITSTTTHSNNRGNDGGAHIINFLFGGGYNSRMR